MRIHNEYTRQKAIEQLQELDLKKVYICTLKKETNKRTIDQNSLYWLWLTCIEQETGQDKNDLHLLFKQMFLPRKEVIIGLQIYQIETSTKDLNTFEFKQYLDKIQIFTASELGITLPDPEDLKFEAFKQYYSQFI